MISDSTVGHLADSFQGLPDAHVIVKHLIPKSKFCNTRRMPTSTPPTPCHVIVKHDSEPKSKP